MNASEAVATDVREHMRGAGPPDRGDVGDSARDAMVAKPEIVHIAVVDTSVRVLWSAASPGPLGESVRTPNTQLTSERLVAAIRSSLMRHIDDVLAGVDDSARGDLSRALMSLDGIASDRGGE